MGEQLQHLGHVARVDLRAGRKDQDPVATGVLESAAQGRSLAVHRLSTISVRGSHRPP